MNFFNFEFIIRVLVGAVIIHFVSIIYDKNKEGKK